MRGVFEDLTGRRFGMLEVIGKPRHNKRWKYEWLCKCDCGNVKYIEGASLKDENTTSCGCERRKKASQRLKNYHKKRASLKKPIKNNYSIRL